MLADIQDNSLAFYGLLTICLIILRLPFIGVYLRCLNTLIHEMGHAIIAIIGSGQVIRIDIFGDTSGTTLTKSNDKLVHFFVSFAGYPFSSFFAFALFYLLYHKYDELLLYLLLGISLTALIFFVRNNHGIFWIISFILLTSIIILVNNQPLISFFSLLYSTIILADALMSSFHLFLITIKKPKQAGDSTNLQKLTKVPAIIWSLIFILQASFLFYLTIRFFFPEISIFNIKGL